MSAVSLPFTLPVKVQAQQTNISFTQNEDGYFMNLDLKLELPLQDLVDSLMLCGEKLPAEVPQIPQTPAEPIADLVQSLAGSPVMESLLPTPPLAERHSRSESVSTNCGSDPVRSPDVYYSKPFPCFDSPYRQKGKWQAAQATYFLRDSPSPAPAPSKKLSPDAPVFTPLSLASMPLGSPTPSAVTADDVWELPGLPSPLMESAADPPMPSLRHQTSVVHSILQRGLSSVVANHNAPNAAACRQM